MNAMTAPRRLRPRTAIGTVAALSVLVGGAGLAARAESPSGVSPGKRVDFVRDVRPILRASCVKCHGRVKSRGQLRLDNKAFALHGGVSGKVILPGNSRESRLVRLLTESHPEERMPQNAEPLSKAKIDVIRAWIDQGAVWPDSASTDEKPERHWAYDPPVRPALPAVEQAAWVRNPIDAFILARLEREGWAPAPEAPRQTLIRRVSLDLTGLPPSPKEVDAFLADRSPDAYERLVDRLLASPHYGERWARPWLDLARYADTDGGSYDRPRAAWRYRDWVIAALNRDLPFDRFTIEQLAGDLLENATLEQKIATGFHRNTVKNEEMGVDLDEARWEALLDRVETTATVWLGTTITCARCHNHKYDPFTQRDYYRLLAFFERAEDQDLPLETPPAGKVATAFDIPTVPVIMERPSAERPATHLRIKGGYANKGERVVAGTPAALHPMRPGAPPNRLGLAQWLVDEENPLVARVTVNRFWAELFGRGLVETPEDFGRRGQRPSHPDLLDWLATEFRRVGFSMKRIHRLIVTSATYRQSSRVTPAHLDKDPENRLLARAPRLRMEAEMIRDVVLAASGQLSRKIGGPSVFPPRPDDLGFMPNNKGEAPWTLSEGEDRYRRGLYTFWRRTAPYPAFTTFDAPSREATTVARPRTNTPLQALTGLNDPAFFDAARGLARRMILEAPPTPRARAAYGFRLCITRHPDAGELDALVAAYRRDLAHFRERPAAAHAVVNGSASAPVQTDLSELAAWTVVANVLLNLDETLTRE